MYVIYQTSVHHLCLSMCLNKQTKNTQQGTREEKKEGPKSKQKSTPQSTNHTMGSPKRKNQETQDLNPSPVAQSKLCKATNEKLGRTLSLEEASPTTTTICRNIMAT